MDERFDYNVNLGSNEDLIMRLQRPIDIRAIQVDACVSAKRGKMRKKRD